MIPQTDVDIDYVALLYTYMGAQYPAKYISTLLDAFLNRNIRVTDFKPFTCRSKSCSDMKFRLV